MKTMYMPDGTHAFRFIEHTDGTITSQVIAGDNERINNAFAVLDALVWKLGVDAYLDSAAGMVKAQGIDVEELLTAHAAYKKTQSEETA